MPGVIQLLMGQMDALASTVEKDAKRMVEAASSARAASEAGGDRSSDSGSGNVYTFGSGGGKTSGPASGDLGSLLSGVPNGPTASSGRY